MGFSDVDQAFCTIARNSYKMRIFTLGSPRQTWSAAVAVSIRQSPGQASAPDAVSSQNPTIHVRRIPFLLVFLLLALCPLRSKADQPEQKLNYTYLYFQNGHPTLTLSRRPQSEANLAARANPDLVFQTGYYSLMLGCDDLQIKGYNSLPGTDYLTALKQDVTVFTPATSLLLEVVQGGVSYQCTHALAQGPGAESPVRLIESGQYLQRIDHLGLVFKDAQGNVLQAADECRLEVSAWADRVTALEASGAAAGLTHTTPPTRALR